ncbi:hypothetical protein D3C76_939360 [compost metagenome]
MESNAHSITSYEYNVLVIRTGSHCNDLITICYFTGSYGSRTACRVFLELCTLNLTSAGDKHETLLRIIQIIDRNYTNDSIPFRQSDNVNNCCPRFFPFKLWNLVNWKQEILPLACKYQQTVTGIHIQQLDDMIAFFHARCMALPARTGEGKHTCTLNITVCGECY